MPFAGLFSTLCPPHLRALEERLHLLPARDHGVEERLQVDLRLLRAGVFAHHDPAAQCLVSVEHPGVKRFLALQPGREPAGSLHHWLLEDDSALVEDDDGVDEVLHVAHLVGGDEDHLLRPAGTGKQLSELALRGDVQAIGRLVEQQKTAA